MSELLYLKDINPNKKNLLSFGILYYYFNTYTEKYHVLTRIGIYQLLLGKMNTEQEAIELLKQTEMNRLKGVY